MPEAAELAPVQAGPAARLDDLMLAMDVVDTLRHHEDLVARELDQTRRDDLLIDRLRSLYRSQGIQVTDRVLQEGVRALKEQRFVYTPPPPGVRTRLALLWVNRGFLIRRILRLIVVAAIAWLAYQLLIVQAAEHREEQRLGRKGVLPVAVQTGARRRCWYRRVTAKCSACECIVTSRPGTLSRCVVLVSDAFFEDTRS